MKIALYNVTTTTKTGGVEAFVWELAGRLAANYSDCHIDIIGGRPPPGFNMLSAQIGVRVYTRPFVARESLRRWPLLSRLYGQTKLLERLSFGLTCLPLLARERYDIVHIQKPYDLPVAQLVRRLFGSRILFGCHGKDYFTGDRFFSRGVPAAVSCSRYNAQNVKEHFGLEARVVYNGIDVEHFSPRPSDHALRSKYAQPGDYLVMQVGRQVRWKGVQYLIEAAAQLQPSHLTVKVLLAGDGPYRQELEELAVRLGVKDAVHFLGNVPNRDLPDYYAIADAVIGTSFANETFGIALCEAAACERPVVASRFGGFEEVVLDGQTGLLYQPQSASQLAERLAELLPDPERCRAMGQAGRQFILKNFTWDAVAERVYQEYCRLMEN